MDFWITMFYKKSLDRTVIIVICLFVVNKCQCWNWRDKSNEADCNPTQILLNLSKQDREKTVAGGGARTWPRLLVRIPVWILLYPASYVHMCYTRFIYQRKEHLSSLAVYVNRRSMRKQSFVCQFASTVCHGCYSCSHTKCKRYDAYRHPQDGQHACGSGSCWVVSSKLPHLLCERAVYIALTRQPW